MRLVILTQVLDRRDAVLGFFHAWCERFAQEVDELVVVAQEVGEVELPANVRVVSLGRERGAGRNLMALRLFRCVIGLRGGGGPTVIWGHMVPRFILNAAPAAWLRGFPMYLWYTHKGVDRSLRLACRFVRAVFTASAESFRHEGAYDRRVVTGHGIDGSQFGQATGPRAVDVLAVGRLCPTKGQVELLDAVELLDPVPSVEFAGDVLLDADLPYKELLVERAASLDGSVTLLGAVPHIEVADVMRRARVLVNTSRTGSVDKVVLEAMAAGAIPLTCNESFVAVFDEELQQRLMFRHDHPDDLAEKLRAVLALSDEERDALGARLRDIVLRDHDLDRLIPAMVARMETSR